MGFLGYDLIKQEAKYKDPDTTWLKRNYLASASAVAIVTALVSLKIIFWMNSPEGLDFGLGLASIGIVTFFGTTLASSVFEEHRHDHGNKKSQSITTVIVGKGIMRKSLAASLVMTYIVLIGLSFSAGTLNDSIKVEQDPKTPEGDVDTTPENTGNGDTSTTGDTTIDSSTGNNVNTNVAIDLDSIGQFLKDNKQIDEVTVKKTDPTSKEMQEVILSKDPETLVEHFTIVISIVIGFYFGANAVSSILKSRKESPSPEDDLKTMYITDVIDKATYAEKLAVLKGKSPAP